MENKCIFCGKQIKMEKDNSGDVYGCNCSNCGSYKISSDALKDLPHEIEKKYKEKMHVVAGYLREMTDLGLETETITNDNFSNIFFNSKIPKTTVEKLDKLLMYIYRKTNHVYDEVVIKIHDQENAIGYASTSRELENMINALSESNYLKPIKPQGSGGKVCVLTLHGIVRAENLLKQAIDSKQGFVAMWFSDSMLDIYDKHISRAIIDAGYEPFIISKKEHNDDICDNIIAEIRKSKFLIADFTGQRGGAYFEAGFAYGLGLPVIWTCMEDWFNQTKDRKIEVEVDGETRQVIVKEERFIHFDINHYNFIVWKDGNDLYEKLKNRILATIPKKIS